MNPPTRADWGDIDESDLDAQWAFKQFFQKPFAEAEEMFQANALYYQEDLQSMPYAAFNFYAPALAKYITSEQARGDSDGASSFLHMVVWMLKTARAMIAPEIELVLVAASQRIARDQQFYDADVDIYGRFPEVCAEIESLVKDRT